MSPRSVVGVDIRDVRQDVEPLVARAVAVRGGRVLWGIETTFDPNIPFTESLAQFLNQLPRLRWSRPRVVVGLGSALVQLKPLVGLPPLADPHALGLAVRQNAARFFLRNGAPLEVSRLRVDGPGLAWAAATEPRLLRDIETAGRAAGVPLRAIVPTVAVLGHAVPSGARGSAEGATKTVLWSDHDRTNRTLSYAGNRLIAIGRPEPHDVDTSRHQQQPVAPLAVLGERAWEFAGAYGAAVACTHEPIAWLPQPGDSGAVPRRRLVAGAVTFAVMLGTATGAPGLAASRAAGRARTHLQAVAHRRAQAVAAERNLRQVSSALAEVNGFSTARRSVTLLLEDLTRALPEGSALVALTVDSVGGSVVALAPQASAVLAALEHVPSVAAPEIVGPVTREALARDATHESAGQPPVPVEFQRVAVRFRFARPPAVPLARLDADRSGTRASSP